MLSADGEPAAAPPGTVRPDEIRRRAVSGAAIVGVRGVAIHTVAFAGNVALARLLVPAEFGTIALGLALLKFASLLSDGGLGAGLVRRAEHPTREELRAMLALQIGATVLLAGGVAAVGIAAGGAGAVLALMMCALPLQALRGPGSIMLQRNLDFRPVAFVEVGEVLAYYACGVGAVAAGFGVWGLASATIVKALVGTGIMLRVAPVGLLAPLPSLKQIRPLLRFGLRFQAVGLLSSLRDDGINVVIAVFGSLATVGLWAIVWRLLQVPLLLFDALWRVSFPAMSQLINAGEDPAPVMRRIVGLVAVTAGLILTALLSTSPALIPVLFGDRWVGAVGAMAPVCLAFQINGPIAVATAGYLFASGQVGVVLRSTAAQVAIFFGLSMALLMQFGTLGVGIGYVVAGLVETTLFTRAVRAGTGIRLVGPVVVPTIAFAVASACGWFVAYALDRTWLAALAAGSLGVALYLAAMWFSRRALIVEVVTLGRHALSRGGQA